MPTDNPHIDSHARGLWERAMEAEKGLRLLFGDRKAAERMRFALYRARNADKALSKKIYVEGTAEYDASPWEAFRVTLEAVEPDRKTGPWLLLITRHDQALDEPLSIEVL